MIYDTNNNRILSANFALNSDDVETLVIRIDCNANYQLACEPVADLVIEAKRTVDSTWINIETTPIDLTTWNNTLQDFDIRITAGTITSFQRKKIPLRVEKIY